MMRQARQPTSAEFGNLYSLLDLVKDDTRFKERLVELDSKVKESERILAAAIEKSNYADETKSITSRMLDEANRKLRQAEALTSQHEQQTLAIADQMAILKKSRSEFEDARVAFDKLREHNEGTIKNREERLAKDYGLLELERSKVQQEVTEKRKAADTEVTKILDQAKIVREKAEASNKLAETELNKIFDMRARTKDFFSNLLGK